MTFGDVIEPAGESTSRIVAAVKLFRRHIHAHEPLKFIARRTALPGGILSSSPFGIRASRGHVGEWTL